MDAQMKGRTARTGLLAAQEADQGEEMRVNMPTSVVVAEPLMVKLEEVAQLC
jgi:hypothetical protein